jgi:hypothetical protein
MWQKGVSGNAGGRPKIAAEVKELARRYGPEAFRRIVQLMRSDDERVALAAATVVLDRAYGRPITPVADVGEAQRLVISWIGEGDQPANQLIGPDAFADVRSHPLVIRG